MNVKPPCAEQLRLTECSESAVKWKQWGPYLSERQWGTVREDYSDHGTAWDYFPHDHARSRAYRWNDDGMGGICDDRQTDTCPLQNSRRSSEPPAGRR